MREGAGWGGGVGGVGVRWSRAEDGERAVDEGGSGCTRGAWRRGAVEVKCSGHDTRWMVWQADSSGPIPSVM